MEGSHSRGIASSLPIVFGAATIAAIAAKLVLGWRINVNWDEFFYLSNVHALARGELDLLLQGAYAHLFQWVLDAAADEMGQIMQLRLVMWALLALSAWVLYLLARCWSSVTASAFATLAFVCSWPVLKHGASFRADSLLLPLTVGALYFVARSDRRWHMNDVVAGLCVGTAFALTTKAALMLPVLAMLVILPDGGESAFSRANFFRSMRRIVRILVPAAILSAVVLALHSTQVAEHAESAASFTVRTIDSALIDVPFLPRRDYFARLIPEDPVYWTTMFAGIIVAVRWHAFRAAACALSILPILFYRNAFPYYYPVMMAPAAVLVGISAQAILGRTAEAGRPELRLLAVAGLGLVVMYGAWDGFMALRFDEQRKQRQVIAAVHKVFPQPVPYLDHSGMIATFPKANTLMSSWGVEAYLRAGRNFMPDLLATRRPPLLLVNHAVLQPRTRLNRQLLPRDSELLEASYVDYWGPIRVAGTMFRLPSEGEIKIHVPFAGRYRIEAAASFALNGRVVSNGEEIELDGGTELLAVAAVAQDARLVWAEAREPPTAPPPALPLYSPL